MRTLVGLHYHVKAGPEYVRLFHGPPLRGPYVDVIHQDIDAAFEAARGAINGHLHYWDREGNSEPWFDDDDWDDLRDAMDHVTYEVTMQDESYSELNIEYGCFNIDIRACAGCVPVGTN